jgi:hypothetical protein
MADKEDWHVVAVPPIDDFSGLVGLATFLTAHAQANWSEATEASFRLDRLLRRVEWAHEALSALGMAAEKVQWDGDYRIPPHVGTLPATGFPLDQDDSRYLVVKQENNGTCFLISRGFTVPLPAVEAVFAQTTVYRHGRLT